MWPRRRGTCRFSLGGFDLALVRGPPPALILPGLFRVRGPLGRSLTEDPVLVLGVVQAFPFPVPFPREFQVCGPPPAPSFPGPFRVSGSVLASALPVPFPRLFQVRSAPLEGAGAIAFRASMAAHNALRDMTMLARLAGEEALQAERSGLITADDVREGDSHDFPSSRAGHVGSRRERPDLRESVKPPCIPSAILILTDCYG